MSTADIFDRMLREQVFLGAHPATEQRAYRKTGRYVGRIALLAIAVILCIPLWFMATGSLQVAGIIFIMPPRLMPSKWSLVNYEWMTRLPFMTHVMNTVIVAGGTAMLSAVIACTAGYAFAILRLPNWLWITLLLGIMLPRISIMIPQFAILHRLGMSGTKLGVILSTAFSPVNLYLARTFFVSVPKEVIESARLDGASDIGILSRIVAPISRPIVVMSMLLSGIASLGDFLWQMLNLQRPARQTLLVALMRHVMVRGGHPEAVTNPLGRGMASAVVLVVPMLIIFAVANRYFTEGLTGAVKE